jgi:CheY-like chemotaxis protein/HPt (histidine-containing phosphotransfer) domain-containing protein
LELINDILDLSKVEAGQLEIEMAPCPVHQICQDVVQVMDVRAREKGIDLRCETEGQIPETILSDMTRLRQILINLVGNAIKFTNEGRVRLNVRFQKSGDSSRIFFDVIDTGIGMPKDALAKIFEPFVQADASVTRRFGGTGLGLAISKRFTEALGGALSVESREGQGTTFTLTLKTGPLEGVRFLDAGEAAKEASRLIRQPAANAIELPPCRVLVVDDGPENRQLIRLVLTRAGAAVEEAANGQEALDHIAQRPCDLILMDMQMPVMDGYTAARRLRDMGVTVPIVALTANAMLEDEERCLKAGCSDFLAKPVNLDDLLRLLAERLGPSDQNLTASGPGGWGENSPLMQENLGKAGATNKEEKAHTAPANDAFAIEETIAALEGQIEELCQSYLGGNYEQVSSKAASLKPLVAQANHPALTSASVRLEQNAVARNANGIEEAMNDMTVILQELQSSRERDQHCKNYSISVASVRSPLGGDGGRRPDEGDKLETALNINRPPHPNPLPPGERGQSEPLTLAPPGERGLMRHALRSSMPMDDPVFREIVQGFVERLDFQIAAMEAAWRAENDQELAFLAHWLKGAGGTMGFAEFTAPARQLEDSAKAGNREGSLLALKEIQRLAVAIVLE